MRLTKRRWATAFAIAVLLHAGVLAVGFWHGSDPGAGVTGAAAISVSLSRAGGGAPSAAVQPRGLQEAETVAAVETAVDAPIEESARTELPATALPAAEAASADDPPPPSMARTMDAETVSHAVPPGDTATVEPAPQAVVSEAAAAKTIAVAATAVEMPATETASTKLPATTLPARTVDVDTATRDVAAHDAAMVEPAAQLAISHVSVPSTVAASEDAADMAVAETAALSLSEPARQPLPSPVTGEPGGAAPEEAPKGPAPVESSKTVIPRAEVSSAPRAGIDNRRHL